jgi:hypothetical protein
MIRSANGKSFVIAILCFVFVYLLPIGFRPMIVPDEVRYAEIPREMIATGDWIVPRLNGLYYFEKPVLGYWITAASMLTFGENPFAVRFPVGDGRRSLRPDGWPSCGTRDPGRHQQYSGLLIFLPVPKWWAPVFSASWTACWQPFSQWP